MEIVNITAETYLIPSDVRAIIINSPASGGIEVSVDGGANIITLQQHEKLHIQDPNLQGQTLTFDDDVKDKEIILLTGLLS